MALDDFVQPNMPVGTDGIGRNPMVQNQVPLGYQARGPAASTYIDQMYQDWRDSQDRSFRDSDLSAADALNNYVNNVANNPNRQAMRDLQMKGLGLESSLYDSGLKKAAAESGLSAQHVKNLLSMDEVDLQRSMIKGQHLLAAEQMLNELSPDPRERAKSWSTFKSAAEEMGIKNVPAEWSPEAERKIRMHSAAVTAQLPLLNKLREIRAQGQEQQDTARIQTGPDYQRNAVTLELGLGTTDRMFAEAFRVNGTAADTPATKAARDAFVNKMMMQQAVKSDPAVELASLKMIQAQERYAKDPTPENKKNKEIAERMFYEASARVRSGGSPQPEATPPTAAPSGPAPAAKPAPPPGVYDYPDGKGGKIRGTWDGKTFTPDKAP